MLQKFIIRQQNIIFFKSVAYLLLIALLVWLRPFAKKDLKEAIIKNAIIEERVEENLMKARLAANSVAEILGSYNKYQSILNSSPPDCYSHQPLINSLQNLSHKYQLAEALQANLFRAFSQANKVTNLPAHLRSYNLHITFAVPNLPTFLNLIKDISALLPENSAVTLIELEDKSILNPRIIHKLSASKPADLIEVKYNVVIYELLAN